MEQVNMIILCSSLSLLFILLSFKFTRCRKNLSPFLLSLPIIGHLHLLKSPVYCLCHRLYHKYGLIFSLRSGSRLVIIISSSTLAKDYSTINDLALAYCPSVFASKHLGYNYIVLPTGSYSNHWRNLHHIATVKILSSARHNAFFSIRTDGIQRLLLKLSQHFGDQFARVQPKPLLTDLTFNNIMRMMARKRYCGNNVPGQNEEAKKFRELIAETLLVGCIPNPWDFLSFLNWFGEVNFKKKIRNLAKSLDWLLQGLKNKPKPPIIITKEIVREGDIVVANLLA